MKFTFTKKVGAIVATAAIALTMASVDAEAKKVRWKMHSAFGTNLAVIGPVGPRITGMIRDMSDGDFDIKVFEPGALAGGYAYYDPVSQGAIDAAYGTPGANQGKNAALAFMSTWPFGPGALEFNAWLRYGGGIEMGKEIYAKDGINYFYCGMIPPETSGWFRKPINDLSELKGLKMRFFVMGAGTAELVATGGARKVAQEIADAPLDEADARLERLQSIARPHRIKEPLSPRRRHLLERNDLPVRGTLLEPPPVATRDLLEDLGLKSDAIRTVRDSAELSPRRSKTRRRPPADWELKASTRSDGDFGATLAEALANAAVDPVLRASDSKLKASSRSGGDFGATLAAALATERVDTPPGE